MIRPTKTLLAVVLCSISFVSLDLHAEGFEAAMGEARENVAAKYGGTGNEHLQAVFCRGGGDARLSAIYGGGKHTVGGITIPTEEGERLCGASHSGSHEGDASAMDSANTKAGRVSDAVNGSNKDDFTRIDKRDPNIAKTQFVNPDADLADGGRARIEDYISRCDQPVSQNVSGWDNQVLVDQKSPNGDGHGPSCILDGVAQVCKTLEECGDLFKITRNPGTDKVAATKISPLKRAKINSGGGNRKKAAVTRSQVTTVSSRNRVDWRDSISDYTPPKIGKDEETKPQTSTGSSGREIDWRDAITDYESPKTVQEEPEEKEKKEPVRVVVPGMRVGTSSGQQGTLADTGYKKSNGGESSSSGYTMHISTFTPRASANSTEATRDSSSQNDNVIYVRKIH